MTLCPNCGRMMSVGVFGEFCPICQLNTTVHVSNHTSPHFHSKKVITYDCPHCGKPIRITIEEGNNEA